METPKHKINLSPTIFDFTEGEDDVTVVLVAKQQAGQPDKKRSQKKQLTTPWQKDKNNG